MGSGSLLKVVLKNFDVFAGPIVTLVYPFFGFNRYASVKAIETKSPVDDQQWLTYWVLYSLLTLFELTFARAIEWLPIWPYVKLIFVCWLVLPYFSGAAYVYQHYLRPIFVNVNHQTVNIWYVPPKKDGFSKPEDIQLAMEKFIDENGPEAFEKLLNKAGKGSKSKKDGGHVSFREDDSENESRWKPGRRLTFEDEVQAEIKPSSWTTNNFMITDDTHHKRYY